MNRRPLYFITRQKEEELIQRLLTIVDTSQFDPSDTAILMVSPDYSATVAMHLAHAWSVKGEMLPIIPVDVPYPDEDIQPYLEKFEKQSNDVTRYKKLVLVEAGVIRGTNWLWLINTLTREFGYKRENITLVALCENTESTIKSDYVGSYYDNEQQELMFYFERYNKHWPVF